MGRERESASQRWCASASSAGAGRGAVSGGCGGKAVRSPEPLLRGLVFRVFEGMVQEKGRKGWSRRVSSPFGVHIWWFWRRFGGVLECGRTSGTRASSGVPASPRGFRETVVQEAIWWCSGVPLSCNTPIKQLFLPHTLAHPLKLSRTPSHVSSRLRKFQACSPWAQEQRNADVPHELQQQQLIGPGFGGVHVAPDATTGALRGRYFLPVLETPVLGSTASGDPRPITSS